MNMQHGTFDGFGKLLYLQNGTPEKSHLTSRSQTDAQAGRCLVSVQKVKNSPSVLTASTHPPTSQPQLGPPDAHFTSSPARGDGVWGRCRRCVRTRSPVWSRKV